MAMCASYNGIAVYEQVHVQGGQVIRYIFVVDCRNNSVEKFQLSIIQNNLNLLWNNSSCCRC